MSTMAVNRAVDRIAGNSVTSGRSSSRHTSSTAAPPPTPEPAALAGRRP